MKLDDLWAAGANQRGRNPRMKESKDYNYEIGDTTS